MEKVEQGVIKAVGWFKSSKACDEKRVCPNCGLETQVLIGNDGEREYINGERCVAGCFKAIHK